MREIASLLCFVVLLSTGSIAEPREDSAPHYQAHAALIANRPSQAMVLYREFLDSADDGKAVDLPILQALSGLGTALVLQDRAAEARIHLRRALRVQARLVPEDELLAAELRHALARAALTEGWYDRALARLMEELELINPYAEQRPEAVARTLRELGRAQRGQGYVTLPGIGDRELELYEQALEAGRIAVPGFLQQVARDSAGADTPFRLHLLRAVALASEPIWRNEAGLAEALRGLAATYSREGDTLESLRWFERAWLLRAPKRFEDGLAAYRVYPNQKAFAMALDAHGRWTFGFYTGEKTRQDAVDHALRECRRRLPWHAIEADCRIYALNEQVVWEPASVDPGPAKHF